MVLQLSAERSVQDDPGLRRSRTLEADQSLHVQGHIPGQPEQPDHRLPEQARKAAGQARHRPEHAAVCSAVPELAELPVEVGVDQRARQPRVPRRHRRQLVQLLPAATDSRFRAVRRPVGCRAGRTRPRRCSSMAAPTTATRIRNATSRRSTPRSRTSRTAGPAVTISRSATTGSAIGATSSRISRSTSSIATSQRQSDAAARQIDLYNSPTSPINDVVYNAAWINDTWKLNNRLTLTLGGRLEHYRDGWPEQQFAPNGHPALAGCTDPVYQRVRLAAHRRSAHRRGGDDLRPARRAGLRPDRRQPDGAEGLFRTIAVEFRGHARRSGEPGGARAAALRIRLLHGDQTTNCDLNGNRLLDGPAGAGHAR